jgi:hypothetical protein
VEDFLLNIQLFRECNKRSDIKGRIHEAVEGMEKFSDDSESYFLDLIEQYIRADMEKSNAVEQEPGTLSALATEAFRNDDVIETPPIARTGHFAFALLDLVQQHLPSLCTEHHFPRLMEMVLDVAKSSQRSFLRSKALEGLLNIGRIDGIGLVKVESHLQRTLKEETRSKKAVAQWRELKKKEEESISFRAQLSTITVVLPRLDERVHL